MRHSSFCFYGPVVNHLANYNLKVHFWEKCSFLLSISFCRQQPSPKGQHTHARWSHREHSSTVLAVFPGDLAEGVTPGVPSRLRHHVLWLFYSREWVRREKSLWHKLKQMPAQVPQTWIDHVFYHQKNLGRTLVFFNVLMWAFGFNCLSYKDFSKHYLMTSKNKQCVL